MIKPILFIVILSISFIFQSFCFSEEKNKPSREKTVDFLHEPVSISRLDWIMLKWDVRLKDLTIKKVLLDDFENQEDCTFGGIRFDKVKNAIKVPILCSEKILKNTKQKRLEKIEKWTLKYLHLFDAYALSLGSVDDLKEIFIFEASSYITDNQGEIVEVLAIGSYEFGEKKLPAKKVP